MASPSAREQLMLELVNRARLDPEAEAKRLGIALNQGLPDDYLDGTSKAPLAMDFLLIDAARAHSQWMIDANIFDHTGDNGSSPHERMEDAGFVFTGAYRSGENIAFNGTTGTIDPTRAILDAHDGLFESPGHRANLLREDFREIGIGQMIGEFSDSDGTFNSSLVTQNFATTGTATLLTGVVYTDKSKDAFYSVGEGKGGVKVAVAGKTATTNSAGGYDVVMKAGKVGVTFGSGKTAVQVEATFRAENAKIDLVDGKALMSSVSLKLLKNVKAATLLGLDDLNLKGSASSEKLTGNKGDNRLEGGAGVDTIKGGAGNDKLTGGRDADTLTGGDGADAFVFTSRSDSTAKSAGRDTITDFDRGEGDRIDLRGVDARTDKKGDQKFAFLGKAEFSGKSGELRFEKSGKSLFVYGDTDGDGIADFAIKVVGENKLQTDDFFL